MNQKIRIKLRSYDHNLVDKSTEKIVKTVRNSGAVVTGPIPLPTEKKIFTVLRSPHVSKKSREQFQLRTHKRLIEIYTPTQKTVDALSKLELPSGVDIQVKLTEFPDSVNIVLLLRFRKKALAQNKPKFPLGSIGSLPQ